MIKINTTRTVIIQSFRTDRPGQTEEQSDQGLQFAIPSASLGPIFAGVRMVSMFTVSSTHINPLDLQNSNGDATNNKKLDLQI